MVVRPERASRGRFLALNAASEFLERRMARQAFEEIADCGVRHDWRRRSSSTILVVEKPGSSGRLITLPPAASTSSRPATK